MTCFRMFIVRLHCVELDMFGEPLFVWHAVAVDKSLNSSTIMIMIIIRVRVSIDVATGRLVPLRLMVTKLGICIASATVAAVALWPFIVKGPV